MTQLSWPGSTSWPSAATWPGAGGWPSAYDWTKDQQILARFKAGSLTDLATNSAWGNLTVQGGSLTTTPALIDGNAAWQFTKGAGVRLVTSSLTQVPGPHHIIIVCRSTIAGGAPANNDTFVGDGGNGTFNTRIQYNTGTQMIIIGGGAFGAFVCTPTNWNLLNGYSHGSAGRTSTNGAAYVTAANGASNVLSGLTIGALSDGTSGAGADIAEVIVIAGQAKSQLMAGVHAYLRAQYPSLALPATPPATFSVDQTVLSSVTAPFDFIVIAGQSNNCCNALSATQAAAANSFMFDRGNAFGALSQTYDVPTANVLDTMQVAGLGGVGGNGTSLANVYAAGTGRPVVMVPCASGGSGMTAGVSAFTGYWDPAAPGARNIQQRDSLYGSMVARTKNMIALGGRFRFLWWYQGEAEAQGSFDANTYKSLVLAMFNQFFSDINQPQRVIIQRLANTLAGSTGASLAAIQGAQDAMALTGARLIGPSWSGAMNADNVHVAAAGCDSIGTAAANLALAQTPGTGWY